MAGNREIEIKDAIFKAVEKYMNNAWEITPLPDDIYQWQLAMSVYDTLRDKGYLKSDG